MILYNDFVIQKLFFRQFVYYVVRLQLSIRLTYYIVIISKSTGGAAYY